MDDVVLAKAASIERAVARVRALHGGDHARLDDLTTQEAIILNLQRGCESAIDLAMHLVRREGLGLPKTSREAFAMLESGGALEAELAARMGKMVGFRNIAVHSYQELSRPILEAILEQHLPELLAFARVGLSRFRP